MITIFYYFYPRSPCGERQSRRASRQQPAGISIHALLAESDYILIITTYIVSKFLSTLSLRRATDPEANSRTEQQISIHALLAESDSLFTSVVSSAGNFYPRSPCGERRVVSSAGTTGKSFLSTLSLRRATTPARMSSRLLLISIHALLAESDVDYYAV